MLICHVISKDHLIEGFFDVMVRGPSREVTILANLVKIVFHVIFQDQMITGLCEFMDGGPS